MFHGLTVVSAGLEDAGWFKSSHSNPNGNCVEAAPMPKGSGLLLRNSRDPKGPFLSFGPTAWRGLIGGIKAGELR